MPADAPPTAKSAPTLAHWLEYGAFRTVERLVGLLPMDSCAVLGRLMGRLFHAFSPRYRRIVRRNLRIATAGNPPPAAVLDEWIAETFRRAGANFLCSLRSTSMSADEVGERVQTVGAEILDRRGKTSGLVVVMPHMGNWEVTAKLGGLHEGVGRFGGVYRPLNNPLMDAHTLRQRSADGCELFSRKDGFHAPISLLRTPAPMGVLADQHAGAKGAALPFFGKMTSCSPLPSLMARRAKAEVASLSIATVADGRWRAVLRPLGPTPDVATIQRALETVMQESLPDVFWFHDRWRISSSRPLGFKGKALPQATDQATTPLRVLLTLPDDDREAALVLIDSLLHTRNDLRIDWLTSHEGASDDPRVICHAWDPEAPPEHADGLLQRIDQSHPAPLDAAFLFDGHEAIARAARRAGIESLIGCHVRGKLWRRSFERPETPQDWARIAPALTVAPPPEDP